MRNRSCTECNLHFSSLSDLQSHLYYTHRSQYLFNGIGLDGPTEEFQIGGGNPIQLVPADPILDGNLQKFRVDLSTTEATDLRGLYRSLKPQIRQILQTRLNNGETFKFNFTISVCFYKEQSDSTVEYNIPTFLPRICCSVSVLPTLILGSRKVTIHSQRALMVLPAWLVDGM